MAVSSQYHPYRKLFLSYKKSQEVIKLKYDWSGESVWLDETSISDGYHLAVRLTTYMDPRLTYKMIWIVTWITQNKNKNSSSDISRFPPILEWIKGRCLSSRIYDIAISLIINIPWWITRICQWRNEKNILWIKYYGNTTS